MGKFQGRLSEFLAAVLGSCWPGAPEKCICLLQMETWVSLTWLHSFRPFETWQGEQIVAGRQCLILPSLAQVTQRHHHSPRGIKVGLFSIYHHVLGFFP